MQFHNMCSAGVTVCVCVICWLQNYRKLLSSNHPIFTWPLLFRLFAPFAPAPLPSPAIPGPFVHFASSQISQSTGAQAIHATPDITCSRRLVCQLPSVDWWLRPKFDSTGNARKANNAAEQQRKKCQIGPFRLCVS